MSDAPNLVDLIGSGDIDPALLERLASDHEALRVRLAEYLPEDQVAGIMERVQELIDAHRRTD